MTRPVRITACLVALLLMVLPGCSDREDAPETTTSAGSDTAPESITTPDTTDYESLIIQLQNSLLEERQNHYISEAEYRARLAQLEAELQRLRNPSASPVPDATTTAAQPEPDVEPLPETETRTDVPTGTVPDTDPEQTISFSYSVEDGCVTIHEYLGGARAVVLPSTVNGYPVTAIADNAFKNSSVTSVVIPSTVKSIGWFAFYGCLSLTSVTVPASVDMIHYAAFDACPSLTVLCQQNSYAASYVQSFGLPHQFI